MNRYSKQVTEEACKVEGEKVKNDQYYRKGIFSNINYTCVTGK